MTTLRNQRHERGQRMVLGALLMAMVIILQLIGCIPQVSANKLSFVLVPIVLGGILLGNGYGLTLGFVFGAIVYIGGLTGLDPATAFLINLNPWFTLICCLAKGMLAGLLSALLYKLLHKVNFYLAIIVAAIAAPLVNTSVYCLCMMAMFKDTLISTYELEPGAGFMTGVWFVFILVWINFLIELAINLILCPGIAVAIRRAKSIRFLK